MRKRNLWGTRFGFYLAAVGSAFGLGNLWRFPYVTVENGGGAFVLLYVIFALIIGLPFLIGELMLGKLTRRSVVSACQRISVDQEFAKAPTARADRKLSHWIWVGRASLLANLLILSYYAVISGWVLHFLMQFFFGHIATGSFDVENSLRTLREGGGLQMALTSVHLIITLIVVVKGVQEGIEKWVSYIMPIFVVLLVVLVTKSLNMPSAPHALRFFFYPDFAQLHWFSPLHAIGHVFFTLSIGFGTMVTFGSYLNEQTKIPSAGFRVTTMDTLISIFAGLLIFPILVGANFPARTGPELLFQTLPRLFLDLDSGFFFGMAFFLCLYLAALGVSIGLLEAIVANLLDFTKLTRRQATWLTGVVTFCIAIVPALSTSVFKGVSYRGHGLLELLDDALINCFVPIVALLTAYLIATRVRPERVENEFVNDESIATRKLYSHWHFIMKWVGPTLIIISFGLAIYGWLIA
jgi:NSS family neurotransmitter:Na+ symporter